MDKLTKKVLKQFINQDKCYTPVTMCNNLKIDDINSIETCFEYLLELNFIKTEYYDLDTKIYSLTYLGKNYFKNSRSVKFEKYWFPILTAIISYLLSLVSSLILK